MNCNSLLKLVILTSGLRSKFWHQFFFQKIAGVPYRRCCNGETMIRHTLCSLWVYVVFGYTQIDHNRRLPKMDGWRSLERAVYGLTSFEKQSFDPHSPGHSQVFPQHFPTFSLGNHDEPWFGSNPNMFRPCLHMKRQLDPLRASSSTRSTLVSSMKWTYCWRINMKYFSK